MRKLIQSRLGPEKGMGGPETHSETDLRVRDAGKQEYGQDRHGPLFQGVLQLCTTGILLRNISLSM